MIYFKVFISAALILIVSSQAVVSQVKNHQVVEAMMEKLVGTQRVYMQPTMNNGRIIGCSFVFEAMIRDHMYRQGQFIKIDGSIAILAMQGTFGSTLKVVVNELEPPSLIFKPSPPSRAYLIGADFQTNLDSLVTASESDTPGALFSIFENSPTFEMLLSSLSTKKITIAFNQKDGGSDLQLPLELDVAETDSTGKRIKNNEAITDFLKCGDVLSR